MPRRGERKPKAAPEGADDPHGLHAWMQRYLEWLSVKNYSQRTALNREAYLSAFLVWCVQEAQRGIDFLGDPAVVFELAPEDGEVFGDYAEEHVGEEIAFVVGGHILAMPTVDERLPGRGILRVEEEDITDVLALLRGCL